MLKLEKIILYKCLESKKLADVIIYILIKERLSIKLRIQLQNVDYYSLL